MTATSFRCRRVRPKSCCRTSFDAKDIAAGGAPAAMLQSGRPDLTGVDLDHRRADAATKTEARDRLVVERDRADVTATAFEVDGPRALARANHVTNVQVLAAAVAEANVHVDHANRRAVDADLHLAMTLMALREDRVAF